MGIDENLLALDEDEKDESGEEYSDEYEDNEEDFTENESSSALRESKQEAKNNNEDENNDSSQAGSLREQVVMAKAKQNEEIKKQEEAISSPNPVAQSTAKAVTSAWASLLGTFLFSILIIDAHVVLGTIFGKKFFPRLGDEWAISKGAGGMGGMKGGEKVNKMMHTVEPMIVILVNLILFLSIIAILALIAMIVGFVSNPLKAIGSILKDTFENWKDLLKK